MGLVVSLIGVSLEKFAAQVSAGITDVGGTFFFYLGLASFITLFAAGPLMDRLGKKPILIAGSLLSAAAVLLAAAVTSLGWACSVMFLLGIGVGCLNIGINTLINELYPENPGRMLNLGNAFFGMGAVFLPLIAGWLFLVMSLFHLLVLTALFSFLPGILFACSVFPPNTDGEKFRLDHAAEVIRDPLVALMALMLFFYVALEASLGIWSRVALVERWQIRAPFDQFALAAFWASFVLGRIIAGTLFRSLADEDLVFYCSLGSCAGIGIFIMAPSTAAALAGLCFAGLCCGPIFPSSLGSAGNCFKHYPGSIFAVLIASGVLGAVVITPAIGKLAGVTSLMTALWLTFGAGLLMLLFQAMVRRKVKRLLKPK